MSTFFLKNFSAFILGKNHVKLFFWKNFPFYTRRKTLSSYFSVRLILNWEHISNFSTKSSAKIHFSQISFLQLFYNFVIALCFSFLIRARPHARFVLYRREDIWAVFPSVLGFPLRFNRVESSFLAFLVNFKALGNNDLKQLRGKTKNCYRL